MKYYAVLADENKIFTDWEECKKYLDGKKGYKQKSFSTKKEAEAFLRGEDLYADALKNDLNGGWCVCYTDGSYEDKVNAYAFGVVAVDPSGNESEFCGKGNDPAFLSSRNVAGEADGVLAAVKWAFVNGYEKVKIYHDYAGLSAWANGVWSARSPVSERYSRELARYRGGVKIEFVKVKGHSNVSYNERVDKLAKKALFEDFCLPVKGYGFKLSGIGEAKILAEKVNKLAPRAAYEFARDGTVFTLGQDKLGVYARGGVTVITGTGGALYFLAVNEVLKTRDEVNRIRVAENAFDLTDLKFGDGISVSYATLSSGKFSPALCVLFALESVIEVIKRELKEQNIPCDKPSRVFVRGENGKFELKADCEKLAKKRLEKNYAFLYENRTDFSVRATDAEKAKEIIDEAKAIVNGD